MRSLAIYIFGELKNRCMEQKYFIAIYTNKVKNYCDKQFFKRVSELSKNNQVHVIDNTSRSVIRGKRNRKKIITSDIDAYTDEIKKICNYENFIVEHIDIPLEPKLTLFHRNVAESVSYLREKFLNTNLQRFLILESDVIPPVDLLERFDKDIEFLPSDWGILGGLYYDGMGFHKRDAKGLQKKDHVLSGCTVYKRELIEKYPFRWDEKTLGAFPDAFICFDSKKEFSFYDDHDIICEHLHHSNGTRYSSSL